MESPAGSDGKAKAPGSCAGPDDPSVRRDGRALRYDGWPAGGILAPLSTCRTVFIDYGLHRLKVAIQAPDGRNGPGSNCRRPFSPSADPKAGLVELVDDPEQADWMVRLDEGKVELIEASGNRAPFPCRAPDSPALGQALRRSLEKVYRARNLVALAGQFEAEQAAAVPRLMSRWRCFGTRPDGSAGRSAGSERRLGLPARRSHFIPHPQQEPGASGWTSRS